jgi:chemotaxis protein methyltransferase CheR
MQLLRQPEGRSELQLLVELVLNHETSFFRNRPHMRMLDELLLSELHAAKPHGTPIRIWSAGCATGEEPYSIAMVAREWMRRVPGRAIEIIGTDLSADALRKAREGVYRGRTLQNLPSEMLAQYFEPQAESYVVNESLRALIQFYQLNLLEPFPAWTQRMDAIFCQNVTIYFSPTVRRALIEQFHSCLPLNGLLFLGFSETLWNVFDGFQSRELNGSFVYYKRTYTAPVDLPPTKQRKRAPMNQIRQPVAPQVASRQLLRAAQPKPVDTTMLLENARAFADRGDLELAIAEAVQVLKMDSLNDQAYLLLGVIYIRQGRWQLAIQQLDRARYLRPEAPLISFHLANAYAELGMIEHAQREYRGTLWKLRDHAPDTLLDGVAVAWVGETCRRQLDRLNVALTRKGV